jgi:Lon protease-like protein
MLFVLSLLFVARGFYFEGSSARRSKTIQGRGELSMKWMFKKGQGNMQELQVIGSEGEYYFHPSKTPTIKGPPGIQSKPKTVPIFPYNSVLVPHGTEWVHIFEMRHRQMLYDIGDGVFGFCYFNQQQQKLALVGTMARVKSKKLLEDGRIFVIMEGIERFYLKEVVTEKPYFRAKVATFRDYTENPATLDQMERVIFDEVRFNVKLMDLLFPLKNYTLGASMLEHRPVMPKSGVRNVKLLDLHQDEHDMERRSKFSFAVMDMLQISSATKLLLLQDHVIERRYSKFLNVLEKGGLYLRKELKDKGILTEDELTALREDIISDTTDVETLSESAWFPDNYVDGSWRQVPTLM